MSAASRHSKIYTTDQFLPSGYLEGVHVSAPRRGVFGQGRCELVCYRDLDVIILLPVLIQESWCEDDLIRLGLVPEEASFQRHVR